jgi:hypothetical protein
MERPSVTECATLKRKGVDAPSLGGQDERSAGWADSSERVVVGVPVLVVENATLAARPDPAERI